MKSMKGLDYVYICTGRSAVRSTIRTSFYTSNGSTTAESQSPTTNIKRETNQTIATTIFQNNLNVGTTSWAENLLTCDVSRQVKRGLTKAKSLLIYKF